MSEEKNHTVVLGAGPLGSSLATKLAAKGKQVRLFSIMNNRAYDMPVTNPEAIDGADLDQVRGVCDNAAAVFLCLNAHYVDWYKAFPPRLDAAIEAAAASGAKLIYHDNVYMYGPVEGPLTEGLANSDKTRKGRLRGEMADLLMESVEAGRVRAAIGRSADVYGPGALNSSFNSTLGQRHFYPALAGKTVSVLGDIDAPHTYTYVDDVADGLIALADHDKALGQIWHLPAGPTLSHRELISLIFNEAGHPAKVRGSRISSYFVRGIGLFQADVAEVAEMLYQFEKPLVIDHSKFEREFGANPTPHNEAVRQTLTWYRQNPL